MGKGLKRGFNTLLGKGKPKNQGSEEATSAHEALGSSGPSGSTDITGGPGRGRDGDIGASVELERGQEVAPFSPQLGSLSAAAIELEPDTATSAEDVVDFSGPNDCTDSMGRADGGIGISAEQECGREAVPFSSPSASTAKDVLGPSPETVVASTIPNSLSIKDGAAAFENAPVINSAGSSMVQLGDTFLAAVAVELEPDNASSAPLGGADTASTLTGSPREAGLSLQPQEILPLIVIEDVNTGLQRTLIAPSPDVNTSIISNPLSIEDGATLFEAASVVNNLGAGTVQLDDTFLAAAAAELEPNNTSVTPLGGADTAFTLTDIPPKAGSSSQSQEFLPLMSVENVGTSPQEIVTAPSMAEEGGGGSCTSISEMDHSAVNKSTSATTTSKIWAIAKGTFKTALNIAVTCVPEPFKGPAEALLEVVDIIEVSIIFTFVF
jgi:hypothetical protein